jgi:hypothetical protein
MLEVGYFYGGRTFGSLVLGIVVWILLDGKQVDGSSCNLSRIIFPLQASRPKIQKSYSNPCEKKAVNLKNHPFIPRNSGRFYILQGMSLQVSIFSFSSYCSVWTYQIASDA